MSNEESMEWEDCSQGTPTPRPIETAQVRGLWVNFGFNVEDFDRWLAEHDRLTSKAAWDEGARWGAVEFQIGVNPLMEEHQVQLADGDNPHEGEQP